MSEIHRKLKEPNITYNPTQKYLLIQGCVYDLTLSNSESKQFEGNWEILAEGLQLFVKVWGLADVNLEKNCQVRLILHWGQQQRVELVCICYGTNSEFSSFDVREVVAGGPVGNLVLKYFYKPPKC